MKKLFITALSTATLLLSTVSCFDLTEKAYKELPVKRWFNDEKEIIMYAARAYTILQQFPEEQRLWSLIENASDELVIPGRDNGEWWGQGRWDELHTHNYTATNKMITRSWEFLYEGVMACNEILYVLNDLTFTGKDQIFAEIKILRAYYYFQLGDNWGNIPFTIDFSDESLPHQKNREFLFDFLENEILDNVELLQTQTNTTNYGRITQGAAYTLLAKLYMSANEWIGTPKWQEAVEACQAVIDLGVYSIEDDYFANFKVNNEKSKENIFVIPYNSILTKDRFYWWTLTLNSARRPTFEFIGEPWDGFVAEPTFMEIFDDNDLRKKSFLFGQQYDKKGDSIKVNGENFVYTISIGDYRARKKWEGARCAKYEYQPSLEYYVTEMENDFVLYRYADVLYMKLEALWRMGRASEYINDSELQKIRTRAGMPVYTESDLTAEELLAERGREFAWEGHRKNDQIRFGTWENAGWNKPVSSSTKRIFPIPMTALLSNPNLVQNP
jgi:hypothetical protein